jgi:hypothetical protein
MKFQKRVLSVVKVLPSREQSAVEQFWYSRQFDLDANEFGERPLRRGCPIFFKPVSVDLTQCIVVGILADCVQKRFRMIHETSSRCPWQSSSMQPPNVRQSNNPADSSWS